MVTDRTLRLAVRVYRMLLFAFPASFRRRYQGEMVQIFRDQYLAARAHGTIALLLLLARTLADIALNASRERARSVSGISAGTVARRALRGTELLCALLAALSGAVYITIVSMRTYSSTICNGHMHCVTTVTSEWLDAPTETITGIVLTVAVSLPIAALIYAHSRTTSRGLLTTMWVLTPIMSLLVIGAAFTWIGLAAFFLAVSLFLAAAAGSLLHTIDRHTPPRLGTYDDLVS
jgi:hypothetical protein